MRDSKQAWVRAHDGETAPKAIVLASIPVLVFTVFFKFAPDLAAAALHDAPSILSSYDDYKDGLSGIHAARFAANALVLWLAKALEAVIRIPGNPRLHPLRISAAIVASLAIAATVAPVMSRRLGRDFAWGRFVALYGLVALLSLQVYKPYDLTSAAFIGFGLLMLYEDRFAIALVLVVVCGLFRESSLHIVWFGLCFAAVRGGPRRWGMSLAMGIAWAAEMQAIRHHFGAHSDFGLPRWTPDMLSPSLWLSVALALLVMAYAAWDLLGIVPRPAAGRGQDAYRFFWLQVLATPAWLVFYHAAGGGLAEFRLLLPVMLPLAYSSAWLGDGAPSPALAAALTG